MDALSATLLVLLSIFLTTSPTVQGNAELKSLMELKSSLDPENKLLQSWTFNGDPCDGSFEGIACNQHLKVANISLQGKRLTGKLSPAVAELKCLSGLYLHYNSLSGEIPQEISNLTELSDLYLNVNNFSGEIPAGIGSMAGLQVMDLCCNSLTGKIPKSIGSLKKLSVLSLQHNKLTGEVPSSLGNLSMLSRIDLSFNDLSGPIPKTLANIPQLDTLDLRNNTLSGFVPPGLKKLNERFQFENNTGLCGIEFPSLRACSAFDDSNIEIKQPQGEKDTDKSTLHDISDSVYLKSHCNQTHCHKTSSKLPQVALISSVITVTITLFGAGLLTFLRYRRRKQKISNTAELSEGRLSTDQQKDFRASPLMSLAYTKEWDPLGDSRNGAEFSQEPHHLFVVNSSFRFNLEEVESATQCFSEANLLSRNSFTSVFKGVLRDGSLVAIRSINISSCKNEEAEFMNGLKLLSSMSHENLVKLRGFCCSRGRGECFLIYDFASKGKLSSFLDLQENETGRVLAWPARVSIIKGIAKGIAYLHGSDQEKKHTIVHRNISVEKILLDEQFNPLIADSGLHNLLADDLVFSALKTSAAMGYLAPEYVTTGRFTEKTDVFAFGVIILQILSGKLMLTSSMRIAAENGEHCGLFIDELLGQEFDKTEAVAMARMGICCTQEIPDNRPNIETLLLEINCMMSE
ncbi:Leucine-rich repeat protein kinase family protein [Raphanus sativus]|uniref:Somatic embryogenesis receptor kinase 4 n=1 Tax=Raphanus sativus TaxID=3726 RepID=A0A6J0KI18_RAPSA|nr:somatic embryogenesis receptor kinase 4 [Raphanus sativus]KAJ4912910.1 Leucine-rich repeat protein kinase family protein [Raphanus sativus]